uniref:Uncharacterized protein n=1 Tax=Plectus sambesii TaxID=2011161 RepID=A0A914X564_9BILA
MSAPAGPVEPDNQSVRAHTPTFRNDNLPDDGQQPNKAAHEQQGEQQQVNQHGHRQQRRTCRSVQRALVQAVMNLEERHGRRRDGSPADTTVAVVAARATFAINHWPTETSANGAARPA